ncbi:MAG: MFS transporter [Anaerolineae bacterium]
MKTYIQLLRTNPDYFRLWIAQAVSLLGDWFNTLVLSALVSNLTDGSGLAISVMLLCRFVPPLIVGPFAGVLIDRFNRKNLLILSDVLRVFIVLGFLLIHTRDSLWLLYVLTVLQFGVSTIFEPGRSALLPAVVHADDITAANVIGTMTWSAMLAAGGALGAVVAGAFGTSTALIFDAASFAVSALLIASVQPRFAAQLNHHESDSKAKSDGKQPNIMDGLRYVRAHPSVLIALLIKPGGVVGSMDTLIIIYATSLFVVGDKGAGSLGILWALFGVGSVLGFPLFSRLNKDGSIRTMRRLIILAYGFLTAGWFIFGAAQSLWIAGLGLFVRAIGGNVYWTYSTVILQKSSPDDYLGRIFSLDWIGWQASLVISIIITGFLLEQLGEESVRAVVFGTGVVSVIVLLLWTQAVRWLENYESRTAASHEPERAEMAIS